MQTCLKVLGNKSHQTVHAKLNLELHYVLFVTCDLL